MLDIDFAFGTAIGYAVLSSTRTGSIPITDQAEINMFLDDCLAIVRKAVAEEIPGFDVGAIQIHSAGPDRYFVSALPSALHRPSIYSNHGMHGSRHNTGTYKNGTYTSYSDKYAAGLEDIIALKHFGSGDGESNYAISHRRGYWPSKGVWIVPRWTIASYFLNDIVERLNRRMWVLGLPGVVFVGDKYS